MKRLLLLPALLLLLLVTAAVAVAASSLPEPSDSAIVVPKSVAGIKLGMPSAQARAAWGGGRGKCTSYSCEYGDSAGTKGWARIEFRNGKVSAVQVSAGYRASDHEPTTTAASVLMAIQTKEGIGIGSKLAALKSAYGKGEVIGKASETQFYYSVPGKGKHAMTFVILGPSKKITSYNLTDGLQG